MPIIQNLPYRCCSNFDPRDVTIRRRDGIGNGGGNLIFWCSYRKYENS
jgi:hypothetical protein